jgi:hypothetical protein
MNNTFTRLIPIQIIIGVLFLIGLVPFQSCDPDDTNNEPRCDTCIYVMKPNIYIYPTEKSEISVYLSFPQGGKITASIPAYKNGWIVNATPSGVINDKYEYLFYESYQPNVWQQNEGWVIEKSGLTVFFTENMIKHGFDDKEIKDFLEYWIPRLINFDYYEIYPQESNIIETVISLETSKNPDNTMRLFYLIKGVNTASNGKINIPVVTPAFSRTGFYVTEWGVILY